MQKCQPYHFEIKQCKNTVNFAGQGLLPNQSFLSGPFGMEAAGQRVGSLSA